MGAEDLVDDGVVEEGGEIDLSGLDEEELELMMPGRAAQEIFEGRMTVSEAIEHFKLNNLQKYYCVLSLVAMLESFVRGQLLFNPEDVFDKYAKRIREAGRALTLTKASIDEITKSAGFAVPSLPVSVRIAGVEQAWDLARQNFMATVVGAMRPDLIKETRLGVRLEAVEDGTIPNDDGSAIN